MNAALALNPRALISLINTGFVVNASAIKYFIETSHHIPVVLRPIQMKYASVLHAAGFLMEFNVFPQQSPIGKEGNVIPYEVIST